MKRARENGKRAGKKSSRKGERGEFCGESRELDTPVAPIFSLPLFSTSDLDDLDLRRFSFSPSPSLSFDVIEMFLCVCNLNNKKGKGRRGKTNKRVVVGVEERRERGGRGEEVGTTLSFSLFSLSLLPLFLPWNEGTKAILSVNLSLHREERNGKIKKGKFKVCEAVRSLMKKKFSLSLVLSPNCFFEQMKITQIGTGPTLDGPTAPAAADAAATLEASAVTGVITGAAAGAEAASAVEEEEEGFFSEARGSSSAAAAFATGGSGVVAVAASAFFGVRPSTSSSCF